MDNVVRKNLVAAHLPPYIPRQVYEQVLSNVLDDPTIIDETIREHVEPFLAIDTENDFANAIKKVANSYVLNLHTILAPTSYQNDNETLHFFG